MPSNLSCTNWDVLPHPHVLSAFELALKDYGLICALNLRLLKKYEFKLFFVASYLMKV